MHSTGEVMGVGETFGEAYAKAMTAAGTELPHRGTAFISVNEIGQGSGSYAGAPSITSGI